MLKMFALLSLFLSHLGLKFLSLKSIVQLICAGTLEYSNLNLSLGHAIFCF